MSGLLLGLLLPLAVLGVIWLFTRADVKRLAQYLPAVALVLGIGVAAFLLTSGRWVFVPFVLPALIPWTTQRARQRASKAGGEARGQSSTVAARFLRMTLDHASGKVDGEVLEGALAGRRLGRLSLAEALALWRECAADDASRLLMESFLDRAHGTKWRQLEDAPPRSAGEGPMTREEARAVLGVPASASEVEIESAFRRVMRRAHPDQGGSDWLAAKVNRAREVLLGR
ncbi:MAG: molecular chaperone DnaJ [Alphaproteobacteria bacterium]|nr:molecular chaperone DnaJ [Alphaproteobacteria bacterium]